MKCFDRMIYTGVSEVLAAGKSVLLLGPRQVGKTTFCKRLLPDWSVNLADPTVKQKYERDVSVLKAEIMALANRLQAPPLVLIDEIQKVPEVLDLLQLLIDEGVAQFMITGSSARKLRRSASVNLLPGRVIHFVMDGLSTPELKDRGLELKELLLYGTLPEVILTENPKMKERLLKSYVVTYLEEEVRQEALVRSLGSFSRFLELCASEAGQLVNFIKLSQEIGVAHATLKGYFEILQDCLLLTLIEPFSSAKTRRRLLKAPKYLFFDLGVRRLAAREGLELSLETMGRLFEQHVGLEILKLIHAEESPAKLTFWADSNGMEIDWVIQNKESLLPIEVKWSAHIRDQDTKHLRLFLKEHPEVQKALVVARVEYAMQLSDKLWVIPWHELAAEVLQFLA